MANPAKDARDKAQAEYPGATVHGRGRNWISHQHPTDLDRFILDSHIGPIHYGVSDDQEIDTAWQAGELGDAPWLWKMTNATFNVYAGPGTTDFDAGQIVRYVHPTSGEDVTFQAQQIQWANDLDQISAIADPQNISHTLIDDDTIYWDAAYGPDLDFRWQAQTARLAKYLTIQNATAIGTPPQFIIDGGNPVLRLPFIFQKSSDIDIYIDGQLWNEDANNPQTAAGNVEFRLAATDEILWWFKQATANDSSEDTTPPTVQQRFRKQGANLFVEVLIPWEWLQSAVYPVEIDPTVDEQISGTTYDGHEAGDSDWFEDGHDSDGWRLGNNAGTSFDSGLVFTTVAVPNGATVTTSYLEIYEMWESGADIPTITKGFDEDSAAAFATDGTNRPSTRTKTTATVSYTMLDADFGGAGGWYSLAGKVDISAIVEEIVARGGWSTGNNIGFVIENDSGSNERAQFNDYTYSSTNAAKLHIEYTTGAGSTMPVFMHQYRQRRL